MIKFADVSTNGLARIRSGAPSLLLAAIMAVDLGVKFSLAAGNTNFIEGDGLAPFSLLDQFYHHENVDLSRQPWLLPWFLASLLRYLGDFSNFQSLFSAYAVTSALAAALCLPFTYLISRRVLGPFEALMPTVLLLFNASFLLASVYPNPTQVYAFFFIVTLDALIRVEEGRSKFAWAALVASILAMLTRWEGALLLMLTGAFLFTCSIRCTLPRSTGPIAATIAVAALALALAIHAEASSTPFGFLINTNAVASPLSAFKHGWANLTDVVVASLNWKFEKLHALGVNVTTPALILAGVGTTVVLAKCPVLLFPAIYWIIYEGIIFIFTLISPVGNISNPQFIDILSTAPVHRYYQILTPVILIFAYLGLKKLLLLLHRRDAQIIIACTVLFPLLLHQGVIARDTYKTVYAPFALSGFRASLLQAANFFRSKDIRRNNIVVARLDRGQLVYVDVLQQVGGYALTVFHFSLLSGRNLTNCTGENLDNPNLFCSVLANSKTVNLERLPIGGAPDFLLLIKPFPSETSISGFARVFDNANFMLLQRQPASRASTVARFQVVER